MRVMPERAFVACSSPNSVAGDVGNDGAVGVYSWPSHFFFNASLAAFRWLSNWLRLCCVR